MLIDQTYFVREIKLPIKTFGNMLSFFEKFERDFLIKVFGYDMYKQIIAYNPEHPENTVESIRNIITGVEFEVSGKTYKWNGLINADKVSPIAYYVYYYYMRDQVTSTTSTGEIKDDHEHAKTVDVNYKLQLAWSNMLNLLGESCTSYNDYYNSLHYYMTNNSASYPTWQWTDLGSVNAFDL